MARANVMHDARRNGELRSQVREGGSTEEEDVVVARQTMTPSPSVSSAFIQAKDTRTKRVMPSIATAPPARCTPRHASLGGWMDVYWDN